MALHVRETVSEMKWNEMDEWMNKWANGGSDEPPRANVRFDCV